MKLYMDECASDNLIFCKFWFFSVGHLSLPDQLATKWRCKLIKNTKLIEKHHIYKLTRNNNNFEI